MAISPGKIYQGSNFRANVTLMDSFGVPVDPTVVKFRTWDPCGGQATYIYGTNTEVQRSGIGQYLCDIVPTVAGGWVGRWESSGGAAPFATEFRFVVQVSPFYDCDNTGYALP
jgi:hypothetical protein